MWLLSFLMMIPVWASAQNITVKGTVKDATGEGMPGVNVLQQGTTNGIITGIEDVYAGNARIFASNGNINVVADAQTSIVIYSANGLLVASLEASNASVAVTPGFYIVKVGNQVTKLAVK